MTARPATLLAHVLNASPATDRVKRGAAARHAQVLLDTGGRRFGRWFGVPVLVLETVGRRSGETRRTPVIYHRDRAGLVVVAANGGADRAPAWFHNLVAAGGAHVVVGGRRHAVTARVAQGAERDRLWRAVAAGYPTLDDYRTMTDRDLPVVVLAPADSALDVDDLAGRAAPTTSFEVRAVVDASPAAVHALLDDSASWPSWTPIDTHEQVSPPGPDGLGELRRFRNGRVTVVEEIVAREPGRRLSYRLLSGLAVRDYRADVDLEPRGEGTAVRWRTRFTPRVPGTGWLYRRALLAATRQFVDGLARAASGHDPHR